MKVLIPLLILLAIPALACLAGIIVYVIWNVFQLADIYDINFWQAIGIALLFCSPGGAIAANRQ
jgi:hypothetical protein